MKSYNGFTPHHRMQAYRWLMTEYASGRRLRPIACDACQQDEGLIEPHSEDYSAPYGPHIGQYGLCYICHMFLHCRFRNPQRWSAYRDAVRDGAVFKPFTSKAFSVFARVFLSGTLPEPGCRHEPTGPTLLDVIAAAAKPQLADIHQG
jgi:hypothetical protein